MNHLKIVHAILNKAFPFLVPIGVICGIILGERVSSYSFVVPWIFGIVTFIGSLKMSARSFKNTMTNPLPIFLVMFVLRILMPIWAMIVGNITFRNDTYTIIGLILFAVLPTGINSAVWAAMYKGNISLSLSIILIDTLLAPFVMPYSLSLLVGANIEMNATGMMMGLINMIVIPSLLGMAVNEFSKGEIPKVWGPKLAPISQIGLITVVIINGGVIAPYFETIDIKLILIMAVVFLLAVSGYVFSWFLSKLSKMKRGEAVSILYSGGMRNISTGIVIAVSYFPSQAAVPVVTGILFQQVVAAVVGGLLNKASTKEEKSLST